jgi:hypothetical protein
VARQAIFPSLHPDCSNEFEGTESGSDFIGAAAGFAASLAWSWFALLIGFTTGRQDRRKSEKALGI